MEKLKNIFIIAGEASGDMHAARLVSALKEIRPELSFSGIGGKLMQDNGVKLVRDIKDIAVVGLFDVMRKLPKFLNLKKLALEKIKEENTQAIIFVDFSGFNLRLAKLINKKIPAIYYISPQVWASRQGRVKTIKEYISKMIVFFKFEEEFYKRYGVDAEYVGHPLLDIVKPAMQKKEFAEKAGLSEKKLTITLLPGSRGQEIKAILPVMLKTCLLIKKTLPDSQFLLAKSIQVEENIYQVIAAKFDLEIKIIENQTYDCVNAADFCLVASGTATLETALMQKPFAIIYKMNLLNYLIYRPMVKLDMIGLVNIVAGKKIVPEFIQFGADPEKIAGFITTFLKDNKQIEAMNHELSLIAGRLGQKGAAPRAAASILNFLDGYESRFN